MVRYNVRYGASIIHKQILDVADKLLKFVIKPDLSTPDDPITNQSITNIMNLIDKSRHILSKMINDDAKTAKELVDNQFEINFKGPL